MSSMRSINTVVDKNPELPDPKPFPKPSQTWMPNPKLTLWQRIKGIFEPDTLFRDMLDALEKRDAAGPQIDEVNPSVVYEGNVADYQRRNGRLRRTIPS